VRPPPPALPFWIIALLALLLGAPEATATPLGDTAVVTLAQQTGGSFGGSRWGSGSSSSSGGGSYSPSSGSSSYGGGSSHSGGGDAGDAFRMIWVLIQIVVWCFSISPVLGFGVLAVGLGFLVFVWMQRS
jgi:uncharacterized membrane protein